MYAQALVDNTSGGCFTKRYTTFKIPKGNPKTFYPFVFNDIMGLDPTKGVLVNDVKLAMMEHMKDGYKFDPESMLTDLRPNAFYNEHPTDNDKVHVLVCVVPANTVSQVRDETCVVPANTGSQVIEKTVQKIREIREEATELGIPQVAILTRIDEACPEIKDDLKNVYKIKYLKGKCLQGRMCAQAMVDNNTKEVTADFSTDMYSSFHFLPVQQQPRDKNLLLIKHLLLLNHFLLLNHLERPIQRSAGCEGLQTSG
ncbi:interferon-induced protein 44-like [Sebastes fasciatus]|uniref:interferon-induced protein 44-like n=1 Tax=Sebastes fasciatus TaxID=394691 RepID=UPI003D9EB78F